MIAEIKGGIDSVKAAMDIVKSVKTITDKADLDSALFDIREHLANLQQRLLDAQQVTDRILEERRQAIRDLEDERKKNSALERYSLVEFRPGMFLRRYDPVEGDSTPLHHACPKCFSDETISVLQVPNAGSSSLQCSRCELFYDTRTKQQVDRDNLESQAFMDDGRPLQF